MELQSNRSVVLSPAEAADLRALFDYLLTGRRLEAGFSADSQARYLRFVALRRALMENDHT